MIFNLNNINNDDYKGVVITAIANLSSDKQKAFGSCRDNFCILLDFF